MPGSERLPHMRGFSMRVPFATALFLLVLAPAAGARTRRNRAVANGTRIEKPLMCGSLSLPGIHAVVLHREIAEEAAVLSHADRRDHDAAEPVEERDLAEDVR